MKKGVALALGAAVAFAAPAQAGLIKQFEFKFDPPVRIPDSDKEGVRIELELPNLPGQFITDLNVGLVIEHTWQGDISVFIEHKETGRGGFLLDRPGHTQWGGTSPLGYDADDFGFHDPIRNENLPLVLDDEADTSINLYAGPDSGLGTGIDNVGADGTPYVPTDLLSIFDGETIGGTWSLTFIDHASSDLGLVHYIRFDVELIPAPGALGVLGVCGLLVRRRRRR